MELDFQLPQSAVDEVPAVGSAGDIEHWQKELQLGLDRKAMIIQITYYGIDDADDMSTALLECYCIWLAAGNISETDDYIKSEKSNKNVKGK